MNDLQAVIDRIKTDLGATDPERLALVSRLTIDAAGLQARALAGEDVTQEMAIVAATAGNLDHHARGVIGSQLSTWLTGLLAKALGVALAGGA